MRPTLDLLSILLSAMTFCAPGPVAAQTGGSSDHVRQPTSALLVEPGQATRKSVGRWASEGFRVVVVVLDERHQPREYKSAAERVAAGGLELYYWIEVGRSPRMAEEHPEWMASLGRHEDWLKLFPTARLPRKGEVAKAFPWVSINYREAFDAHLNRVKRLLNMVSTDYRGLLLNDLQGGPASCGCGNLHCRWATDYQVPATATKIEGDDVAAKFVRAVQEIARGKEIVPVWTTECDEEDLPADKRAGEWTTGYSGSVGCAVGRCPKDFSKQWSALAAAHGGNIAILALHREFGRVFPEYGETTGWVTRTVDYLDRTLPRNGAQKFPHHRLWVVIQGQGHGVSHDEENAARLAAARSGAGVILVARTRIHQSYQPYIMRVKSEP